MSKSFNPYHISSLFAVALLLYILGVHLFYSPDFEAFTGVYIVLPQMLGVFAAVPVGIFFCIVGIFRRSKNEQDRKRYVSAGVIILILQFIYIALIGNGYYLTV